MVTNKRGISDVVTTVLIILLALAAVFIVWSFIRPAITNTGEQVETQTACIEKDVVAVSCDSTAGSVLVRNNKGDATDVRVVVEASDGTTTTADGSLTSFGSTSVSIASTAGDTARVAAVVTDSSGNEVACSLSEAVTCN